MRLPAPARVLLLALAVVAVQLATQAAGKGFYLTQLTMTGWYALAVLGLSLLMGYAGQISLGHAGFFAIGGYGSALLTTWDLSAQKAGGVVAALGEEGMKAAMKAGDKAKPLTLLVRRGDTVNFVIIRPAR